MQPVASRIWTRVAVSISYDDNHYTTGISKSNAYNGFSSDISFIIQGRNSWVWRSSSVNKERNITIKTVVSVWFIHFFLKRVRDFTVANTDNLILINYLHTISSFKYKPF